MKDKLKSNTRKYLILSIAMLGLVTVLTMSMTDKVNAFAGSDHRSEFAAAIAERFGLDQTQVEETIQEFHAQEMETRQQEMQSRFEARLQTAVSEGSLTSSQMQAILEKHDEMQDRMQELHDQDLSPDDRREMMADIHDEMQAWADEQGIDYDVFLRIGRNGMGHGSRRVGMDW